MEDRIFRAPGRVEIGGNHTDHQRGRVIAAAIDLETICKAQKNGTETVRLTCDGYGEICVDLSVLTPHFNERGTAAALVRGVAAWLKEKSFPIGGFDGRVSSTVPVGEGLSSSAALAVLMGNVFKGLFGGDATVHDIALAGQYAENVYFGKPCNFTDPAISSYGGINAIDFFDPDNPIVNSIKNEIEGYTLCVVYTGESNVDLSDNYAAIPAEMKMIARHFGEADLRAVDPAAFYSEIKELRKIGDRAVLRAMHFFEENERVIMQAAALNVGNTTEFLQLVNESGQSSLKYLQNIVNPAHPTQQGLALAMAICDRVLGVSGAYRVHGSGFAGSILAFVPEDYSQSFQRHLAGVFGDASCLFLQISSDGGREEKEHPEPVEQIEPIGYLEQIEPIEPIEQIEQREERL